MALPLSLELVAKSYIGCLQSKHLPHQVDLFTLYCDVKWQVDDIPFQLFHHLVSCAMFGMTHHIAMCHD